MFFLMTAISLALPSFGAERTFNFGDYSVGQIPSGFRSTVAGAGTPGDWKVILDESAGDSGNTSARPKRAVLAQLARSPLDHHFPILIFDEEIYDDFKLTTRFKVVDGGVEQMAGIVFHFQNESNFHVVRASVLGKNFRCYKVENGILTPPIGPEMEISKGEWHELTVQWQGTRILCALDGKEAIKLIGGSSAGKIGFWTKSDSVSYFADTKITYTPREILARVLLRDALEEYPRVLGLAILASPEKGRTPSVVASKDNADIGKPAGKTEEDVISQGNSYFARSKGSVTVTRPLRDRNGDPIAAVRITLKSFPGQTEDNAVARAMPIVKQMQARVHSLEQLVQ
jgi:hypothetical protein